MRRTFISLSPAWWSAIRSLAFLLHQINWMQSRIMARINLPPIRSLVISRFVGRSYASGSPRVHPSWREMPCLRHTMIISTNHSVGWTTISNSCLWSGMRSIFIVIRILLHMLMDCLFYDRIVVVVLCLFPRKTSLSIPCHAFLGISHILLERLFFYRSWKTQSITSSVITWMPSASTCWLSFFLMLSRSSLSCLVPRCSDGVLLACGVSWPNHA